MNKFAKIIMFILSLTVFSFAVFFYVSLMGTPWMKIYHRVKVKDHLAEKYSEEMVVKKGTYNFKDGSYGAVAQLKSDASIEFSVYEHWDETKGYIDTYPEHVWERQLVNKYQGKILNIYPNARRIGFSLVMGVSDEMNIRGQIPHYSTVKPLSTLVIRVDEKLSPENMHQEMERLYRIIGLVKGDSLKLDMLIVYHDKSDDTKNAEKYINIGFKSEIDFPDIRAVEDLEPVFRKAIKGRF